MDTQGMQSKLHPMPVKRQGTAIGVPKGNMPTGGRKKDSGYAIPNAHKENVQQTGSPFPSGNAMPSNTPQVNQQPRIPFDQLAAQKSGSGQSFPYGSGKAGFGFDRLNSGS